MSDQRQFEGRECPNEACDHAECIEQQWLRGQVAYWKDRCERAENALVLATDHDMPAW